MHKFLCYSSALVKTKAFLIKKAFCFRKIFGSAMKNILFMVFFYGKEVHRGLS